MWELAYIAESFPARRQAIFEDIDRKDGPMWSQIYVICMDIVKSVESHIDDFGKAPVAAPAPTVEPRQSRSAPLREDPIYADGSFPMSIEGEMKKRINHATQSPGDSPASRLAPIAKKTLREAKDRVLTREQQALVTPEHIKGQVEQWVLRMMRVDAVAVLFQHSFRTQFAAAVLGTPYAEPTLCINAIHVLCQLSAHSLTEDQFGNVHRDVASIIRTLTTVIRKLEDFRSRFPVHWTDVESRKSSPEVDKVVSAMKIGLKEIVAKFEPYGNDLRLTSGDISMAKEAALIQEGRTEMAEVR